MQFRVPQFIDVEDKLFGPLTFVQFVYLGGGAGIVYLLYKVLPLWLAVLPMALVGGLAGLLAFYKINNKPFIHYMKAGFGYFISGKLFIWKQRPPKANEQKKDNVEQINQMTSVVPVLSSDKLRDLSWSLDVEGKK